MQSEKKKLIGGELRWRRCVLRHRRPLDSHTISCRSHDTKARVIALTMYGHVRIVMVHASNPANDLDEPSGVVVNRYKTFWTIVTFGTGGGGYEEASFPQV